jgi:hypothetical protein
MFTAKVWNFKGDTTYITKSYPKISEAQAEASRYIHDKRLHKDWKFGTGTLSNCSVQMFKGNHHYANYGWVPYHEKAKGSSFEIHGGYFRKEGK